MMTETGNPVRRGGWRDVLGSLQFKASLLFTVSTLVITGAGVAVTLRTTALRLYGDEFRRARDWAVSQALAGATAVAEPDPSALVEHVNDLIRSQRVAYAVFTSPAGHVLAAGEATAGLLDEVLTEGRSRMTIENPGRPILRTLAGGRGPVCIDVTVPVFSPESAGRDPALASIRGYLRLATDVSDIRANLDKVADYLTRAIILLLLLVVPLSLLMVRRVVAPLHELARTARALAEGSMDARAKVLSHDEIGDLARAFNDMADRLSQSRYDLLKLNAELERRVQERTRDLEQLAARDPLTCVYNRRYFTEVIAREFAAAERYDSDLTCMMFDLDRFKEINDRFGHRKGDEVLLTAANVIAGELRDADVAARFGGDEFVVLLPQTSAPAAAALARRITARFAEELARLGPELPATLSIGIASLRTTHAATSEALIHEADVALYAAKQAGRNQTVFASASAG